MRDVRGLALLAGATAALVLAAGAPATSLTGLERAALAKLAHAPLDGVTKTSARAEIARAAHLVRTLPAGRGYHVAVALQEAAWFGAALTEPRALELYGALRANDDYFARHWAPADHTDIVGADGVVYRYFAGHCFRFHPLGNFGVLNARANAGDAVGTQELADALVARGVYQTGGGIAWEYDFPFGGGSAPWLSGMAQAVAAQAFARASAVVPARMTAYLREAQAAYRVIPRRLLTTVAAGPWIRLYAFDPTPVLNAQLQATISLQSYAAATGDTAAGALAARMENAAAATLPRFDTGYWSYYALPNVPSPVDYHHYVVQLLTRLARTDPRFADAAKRFAAYEKQPPAFRLANAGVGQVRFWLSKPATVTAETPAGPTKRLSLLDGWHTLTWAPRNAGVYAVHVTASDWLGNRTEFDALPIVRVNGAGRVGAATGGADGAGAAPFVVARRVPVVWPDGATSPDPSLVAALASVPSLYVELDATTTPTDAFTQYAAALAQQVPSLRYLVVDAATLAAVRAAVQQAAPAVAVGAVAAPTKLVSLTLGDGTTVQLLDRPTAAVVAAASCSATLGGVVLDQGVDEPSVDAAIATVVRGTTVCPGLAKPAVASTLAFPASVSSGVAVSLQLGCVRDCLYVATLVAADRSPVVAKRGALRGGAAPATVVLPKTTLGQASYTVDVRLVNRVNPGPAVTLQSAALPRS